MLDKHPKNGPLNTLHVYQATKKYEYGLELEFCSHTLSKSTCIRPHPPSWNTEKKSSRALKRAYLDFIGPLETHSIGGSRYFIVLIDDLSLMDCNFSYAQEVQVLKVSRKVSQTHWESPCIDNEYTLYLFRFLYFLYSGRRSRCVSD